MMFLLIICFLGDLAPLIGGALTDEPMSTSPEFYNRWCYPFTLVFVAALMGCNMSMSMKVKRFIGLIASIAAIGVILALLRVPTPNWMANFGLPLLLATGFAIAYSLVSALRTKNKRQSAYIWGRALLHIAIVIILIGVFVSSSAETESRGIIAKPNSTVDALGVKMTLGTPTIYPGIGHVYDARHFFTMPEYSGLALNVSIADGAAVYNDSLRMYYYTNHGIVSKPLIISTLRGDLYIFTEHTNTSYNSLFYALMGEKREPMNFRIKVKRVPLIWLVWSGIILMAAGMVILISAEVRKLRMKRKNK